MRRKIEQMGLADGFVAERPGSFLVRLDEFVDWTAFEAALADIYSSTTGRPSYPLLVLFKTLLLQQWYCLSDPQMEEALFDRISFRRFVGLGLSDSVPDHSTISRFRTRLGGKALELFEILNGQLDTAGLIVRNGTMMDASFVKAASNKKRLDPEAGQYGSHGEQSVAGYKAHVAMDQEFGIVRRVVVTPANINDTSVADQLIMGDEQAVYADKAYDKRARRQLLADRNVFVGIMHRPESWRPLTKRQTAFNNRMTKIRSQVEQVFAVMKHHYRLRRTRYRGLTRVTTQIVLTLMAMNLKKSMAAIEA